jgi:hypothetical protein
LSRSLAFILDETAKKAELVVDTWLPPTLFSDRMGSSYLIGDTTLLQCASKQKTVVLTNFQGGILWQLNSSRIMSYRAQFISKEKLTPSLIN